MTINIDELIRDSKKALDFSANSIERSIAHNKIIKSITTDTVYALIDLIEKQGEKIKELSRMLDKQLGTPCEQIRHKQENGK